MSKHPYELEVAEVVPDGGTLVYSGHVDKDGQPHPEIELPAGPQYVFRTRFNDSAARAAPDHGWTNWTGFNAAGVPFVSKDPRISEPNIATSRESPYSETLNLEELAMACCGSPDPAILEKNSRLFCRNCKRYLDVPPNREEAEDERAEAGDTGRGDQPGDR